VRQVDGAPEGMYTLAGLNARARVYRYEPDSSDRFAPHYDEVWPAGSLTDGAEARERTLNYDSWKYSSQRDGAWSWVAGDRVSQLSLLLYLNDDFAGGETLLLPRDAKQPNSRPRQVAIKPVTGGALCFGQSFKLNREDVNHSDDALLHEGRPVASLPEQPSPLRPAAKYVLRTDVCYAMPPLPIDSAPKEAEVNRRDDDAVLKDPQAAQEMAIELSDDVEVRRRQLALLNEYGYDTSAWDQ